MSTTPAHPTKNNRAATSGWIGINPNKATYTGAELTERVWTAAGDGLASANTEAMNLPNGSQWMRRDGPSQERVGGTWYSRLLQGVRSIADVLLGDGYKTAWGDGDDVTASWTGSVFNVLPAADDTTMNLGNGTVSFDLNLFGNIATAKLAWDASANLLSVSGPVRTSGTNVLPSRYELRWTAGARGKPSANGDILSTSESTREIADPDFEVLGTNATSGSATYNAEGGIKLTTAGADGDSVIVLPHLDANQTAWSQVTWGTDKETVWEGMLATDASIAATVIWAGLKLTNTPTTATDNDQAFFRYEAGVNSGKWQAIYSIGGTDTATDTGVTAATATVYHFKVAIGSDRTARFWINGTLVVTSSALSNAVDLIPYMGVAASGAAAAKAITVYGEAIGRNIG